MDETLVIQAQLKATGADIHDLNNVLGNYRASDNILANCPSHLSAEHFEEARLWYLFDEEVLKSFVRENLSIREAQRKHHKIIDPIFKGKRNIYRK